MSKSLPDQLFKTAETSLENILDYSLKNFGPEAKAKTKQIFSEAFDLLSAFPYSGPVAESFQFGTKKIRIITVHSYRIVYRPTEEAIYVYEILSPGQNY
jgi:plasmid stabilization system protein ParE